jgi:hypothetical protein
VVGPDAGTRLLPLERGLEHTLELGGEYRIAARRRRGNRPQRSVGFGQERVEAHAHVAHHARMEDVGDQQREEQVLGRDRSMPATARLFDGPHHGLPCALREPIEHRRPPAIRTRIARRKFYRAPLELRANQA